MRQLLKTGVLFILFIIPFYFFSIFLWGEYMPVRYHKNLMVFLGNNSFTYLKLQEAKRIKNIDILFIGSSHCYRGFDTRIFRENGFNSYNFGSGSQTPIQTELLLKRYFNTMRPKTVVFEVNPLIFSLDGLESALDIASNQKNDLGTLKMVLDYNNAKGYNTLLFNFYEDFYGGRKKVIKNYERDEGIYIAGGFVEKKNVYYKNEKHKKSNIKLNRSQINSFKRIISFLSKKHVQILLVQAPVTKSLYHSYKNKIYFENLIRNYGKFYNFNELMNLDDSLHFYDADHLNQLGVEIFNAEFLCVCSAQL